MEVDSVSRRSSPERAQRGVANSEIRLGEVVPEFQPDDAVMRLQRALGNQEVQRWLQAERSRPRVSVELDHGFVASEAARAIRVQRKAVTVALAKMVGGGLSVASVIFNYRKSTGKAYGQGSHTTAWTSFEDMVRLRVEKQTLPKAAQRLQDCYDELLDFPSADSKSPKYIWARGQARLAIDGALRTPDKDNLEYAMEALLDMRQRMPLTSNVSGSRKVGNEAYHQWLLEMERMARTKGTDPSDHKYYDQRYECFWALFDYQPTDGVSNDTIEDTIDQHLLSMQATYEKLFTDDHLTFEDAMEYFLDKKNTEWARFTGKLTDDDKEEELRDDLEEWTS